jgi:enoyl-CoA hydratase
MIVMFKVHQKDGIAVVEMRHGKANALDTEFCKALTDKLNELEGSARAVVITGSGHIFCAGVDLVRALDAGPSYFKTFLPALHRLYETIFYFPRPIVAAINGHAVAGGCVLACATDWRAMRSDAGRIGVTELLVGLPFPALAFEIMRFVCAPHRFEEVIFTGATFAPEAGRELGMVDELASADAVMERAQAAARRLAALSPAAFALTKRQSRQPVTERMKASGVLFDAEVETVWCAAETFVRIRDYVARTLRK